MLYGCGYTVTAMRLWLCGMRLRLYGYGYAVCGYGYAVTAMSFNPTAIKDENVLPTQKGKGNENAVLKQGKSKPKLSSDNTASKSSTKKRKSPSPTKHSKNSDKKKPIYPMGLSIKEVSIHGQEPECPYCRTKIKVGKWHAIKKTINDTNKLWKTEKHYHFRCASDALSPVEMKQLTTIVRVSKDVGADDLDELLNGIE